MKISADYVPYVPVRDRKRQHLTKLGIKLQNSKTKERIEKEESSDSEKDEENSEEEDAQAIARKANISLLDQHTELKKMAEGKLNFVYVLRLHPI